jgi:hypothetical protein
LLISAERHSRSDLKLAVQLVKRNKSVQQLQTNLTHEFTTLDKLFDMPDCESDPVTCNPRLVRHFEFDEGWAVVEYA